MREYLIRGTLERLSRYQVLITDRIDEFDKAVVVKSSQKVSQSLYFNKPNNPRFLIGREMAKDSSLACRSLVRRGGCFAFYSRPNEHQWVDLVPYVKHTLLLSRPIVSDQGSKR